MEIFYIEEPRLIFGNDEEEVDPKFGITENGPYHPKNFPLSPNQIKIGIIGDGTSIGLMKKWLSHLDAPITNDKTDKILFPIFPGCHKLGVAIILSDSFNRQISNNEIDSLVKIPNTMKRIALSANLFQDKIRLILQNPKTPDVIICILPAKLDEYIGEATSVTKNITKKEKYTPLEKTVLKNEEKGQKQLGHFSKEFEILKVDKERYFNFRRVLKAKNMEIQNAVPIQIIRPRFFSGNKTIQIDSEIAWNLFVGLYYKAGGLPWIISGLEKNTCYIGISFYKERETQDMRTSLAQIFSSTGEGFVLRGKKFTWRSRGYPHLDDKSAKDLLIEAITLYRKYIESEPKRIVVHKSSFYSQLELKGFKLALKELNVKYYDLVSFGETDIRFLRTGIYPTFRGTAIKLPNDHYILYSTGFSPHLITYRGWGIPRPLFLTYHEGDSDIETICQEILSLTKLNWNSADFNLSEPITINFARRIGHILSEYLPNIEEQHQFKFYM